jgi:hypothetical protein
MNKYFILIALLLSAVFLNAQVHDWVWAQSAGGTGHETGSSIAVDYQGYVYVTGSFQGTATFGTTTLTSAGGFDIYVAKLEGNGSFLWAYRAGGPENDYANGLVLDTAANIYLTGGFNGTATFGFLELVSNGMRDIFAAKLSNDGNFLWAVRAGGTADEAGRAIAVDTSANVYLTGDFEGTATFGTTSLICSGAQDIFASKLDSDGDFLWAIRAGGTGGDDNGWAIATDADANVYLTGNFNETANFGSTSLVSDGGMDIFISKLDTSGEFIWAVRAGGTGVYDVGYGIAVDGIGRIYLAGFFYGTAYFGTHSVTSNGYDEICVAQLNSSGDFQWVASAGGIGADNARGIALDDNENIYVTGFFYGTISFGTSTVSSNGYFDIFTAKLDTQGNWLWALSAGSASYQDVANAIAIDYENNVYLTGWYQGTASFGSTNLTSVGSSNDIFVAKLSPVVGNEDEHAPAISALSFLSDAYPNPFNAGAQTHINASIGKSETGTLSIFNLRGQCIVRHELQPGEQEIVLSGSGLASGVYLYQLKTQTVNRVKKLVRIQ